MTKLNQILTNDDDQLYCHYQGQTAQQPVSVSLHIDTGNLCAAYDANIGPCRSMKSFHGIELEWRIPALKMEALKSLFNDIAPLCQIILDNSSIEWNGSNNTGVMNDQAKNAHIEIENKIDENLWDSNDIYEVWDCGDFFEPINILEDFEIENAIKDNKILLNEKVKEIVEYYDDVNLDSDDLKSYIVERIEERIEESA